MSELPPPGNYWLITVSGDERKAIVTEYNGVRSLIIHQQSVWVWDRYNGERWWEPALEDVHEEWSFVPRV